ncbi:MAG: flagellar biosynthetic protein FliO [Polyangiaceae bacterium]|nr:flagellar biosynthetic protein FliO [Polyangiaceae bacterium]
MNSYTTYLVESLITLATIVAIAILILSGAKRFGFGKPQGPLNLVGKLPLDSRRSIYLVQIAEQILILASSENGITKLGELSEQAITQTQPTKTKHMFADLLNSIHRPKQQNNPPPTPTELTTTPVNNHSENA